MKRRSNFTLVELMVAMGVFVVLLMVSMQIFGGARKLWVRSEQKNNTFSAARTAMEFVAARLQTCIYTEEMPFELHAASQTAKHYESVFFATTIPMNRKKGGTLVDLDKFDLRFIKFELEDGVLTMRIFSDRQNGDNSYENFSLLLPPYRSRRGKSYSNACSQIESHLASGTNEDVLEIMENVTSFKLFAYDMNNKKANAKLKKVEINQKTQNLSTPPYLLEIEISALDSKENFRKWKKLRDGIAKEKEEKKEIETESGYTFRRAVLLGDWRNER